MPERSPITDSKDLIARLPRTFAPALNDQFRQWDVLFPAEQRALKAQLEWLSRLPPEEFTHLLSPVFDIEKRMELPRWESASAGMSVQDVGLLARSPYYPQWRTAVERVFAQIDDGLHKSGQLRRPRTLVLAVLPPGIPLGPRLWSGLADGGRWVPLDRPFRQLIRVLVPALAKRECPAPLDPIETTWIFECDTALSSLSESTPAVVLSWAALEGARREFLNRLNRVARSLRSVDQTTEDLKRIDMARLIGPPVGVNLRVREFVRALFLSGNGSLVFNNSFVQWGASEALRRAQPQVLIASFGIRPKLKPFSSAVLFEDQARSNPTPDQDDTAGSAIDAQKLAEYVYLSAQRVESYQGRSLNLLAAGDLNRVLVLGPEKPRSGQPLSPQELQDFIMHWLATDA